MNEELTVQHYQGKRVKVDVIGREVTGTVRSVACLHGDERVSLVIKPDEEERLVGVAARPDQVEVLAEEEACDYPHCETPCNRRCDRSRLREEEGGDE